MVRLFDIENGNIIPTEHCYTLQGLKAVMEEYPQDYMSVYAYLFYMSCPNPELNPFFDAPEEEREELILKEVGGNFSTEDDVVIEALNLCKKLYETPTARAYRSIQKAIDNMSKVLATEVPTFGRDGSAAGLLRIMEKFDAIRQSFKGVYKDLQEEQQSITRGGQRRAYDDV